MEQKKGVFYGVGVGPGDPELMTLKALRILRECPVIAAPRTRSGEMLALEIARQAADLGGKTILPLDFTMEHARESRVAAHRKAAAAVEEHLALGRDVAMLNLGDVSIYATYSYLMEILREKGYETVMIPGVPSFCAVAARLGISLTDMDAPVHIVPAGFGPLSETLDLPGTKVLMKSASRIPQVIAALRERGLAGRAAMVEDCCLPGEQVCTDLNEAPDATGYFATIIVRDDPPA